MKIGVYFCKCGTNIADKIDGESIRKRLDVPDGEIHYASIDFLCSEEGKKGLEDDLRRSKPDRVVVAACSPRDHELTFRRALTDAGVNPFLMQMVNIREQVAWVTESPEEATEKAIRLIRAALHRVALQEPLEITEVDMCPDVLVIGAGPAGIKAALNLAESGRKVTLVEKSAAIGGMPVQFEELFPRMECGPCMLEPPMGDLLHGPDAERIELLTLSEVTDVVGFFGNYTVKIRKRPRYVDLHRCIGCWECVFVCPVDTKNEVNYGRDDRKAISFAFTGALPNAPRVDDEVCLRNHGESCTLCSEACPVENTILYQDGERILERQFGAIVIATGAAEFDCRKIPSLKYGDDPDVYTGVEFERVLASNGPTGGELKMSNGETPASIAIVHCVGSLDPRHKEYCSGVCCQYAFKFNHIIEKKAPGAKVVHLYKELVFPGKEEYVMYNRAKHNPASEFLRYSNINEISVQKKGDATVVHVGSSGRDIPADMVILCPAMVPSPSTEGLGRMLEVTTDTEGFLEELHGRMDAAKSKVKGVFLAGTCQSPMNIQQTVNQAMASTGYVLSSLVEGRKLQVSPVTAKVNAEQCSGCGICVPVCPYKAISFDTAKGLADVNAILCQGCGTCVAACPSSAMIGRGYTDQMIMAEIDEVLR